MQHQLIDSQNVYHPAPFVNKEYSLLSIVGSQSSGKSTLLNEMFQLQFDVMQSSRKQTTKGVVLDTFNNDTKQVIVCDVEGSDGREHGDEQKTERLLLLFALSVSDIMLFNLFENSVGLYHGANMGLMRMVLEIYYEIFIEKHQDDPIRKKTLLFVVRDYTNTTPVDEMRGILYADIATIWSNLTDKNVDLYFDVNIHALPHFKLQKQEFQQSVSQLKTNIIGMSYHDDLRVHTDSLNEYMSRVWELITKNKELDVPTQMELVMKYRVERLGQECLDKFKSELAAVFRPEIHKVKDAIFYFFKHENKPLPETLQSANACILQFSAFISKLDELAKSHFEEFQNTTKRISIDISETTKDTQHQLHIAMYEYIDLLPIFNKMTPLLEELSDNLPNFLKCVESIKHYYSLLIPSTIIFERSTITSEFNKILIKEANSAHSAILDQLEMERDWRFILKAPHIHDAYRLQLQATWSLYLESTLDSGNFEINVEYCLTRPQLFHNFQQMIRKLNATWFSSTAVLQYLRQSLEDGLLYINNTPRLYQNNDELSTEFNVQMLKLTELFKKIKDPHKLKPPTVEIDAELLELADQLALPELTEIGWQELKRYSDTLYIDHQRRIMQNNQKIPKYIYLILLLLGWNEMMMILSNPIYLVLGSLLGIATIIILQLGLMPMVQHVGQELLVKGMDFTKQKMRDLKEKQKVA